MADAHSDDERHNWRRSSSKSYPTEPDAEVNGADDDFEVLDYDASGSDNRRDSPSPDELPRLPSPSDHSSRPETSHEDLLHDEPTSTTLPASPVSRQALAQRLARIARQLATTSSGELRFDDLTMVEQVNRLELTLLGLNAPAAPEKEDLSTLLRLSRTASDLPIRTRNPPLPVYQAAPPSAAVTDAAAQLSSDLATLLTNLRARHEESTHIQSLLLSRLELAAQRVLFLQRRSDHLEQQIQDSDEELSHLRVLLKALEIQMPDHPDEELRRCLARVRQEFWEVKRKRDMNAWKENDVKDTDRG